MDLMEKNKGAAGTVGIDTPGAFNAIYGPYLQNLAYNMHNTLAVMGQKPYRTGYRFQVDLSLEQGMTTGRVRGGYAGAPVYGQYEQVEMPFKLSAKRQAMGLGYVEIGDRAIDDVMVWEQFMAQEGQTWLWSMNNDVLRNCADPKFTGVGSIPYGGTGTPSTEFVGIESIDRIISNYAEGTYVDVDSGGNADATATNNVPWAMATQLPSTDSASVLAKYRNPAVTGAVADSNFDSYVDANYTGANTATLRNLTVGMIDSLFMGVMPYWEMNKTEGKVLVTGYDTLQQIQTLLQPQQRFLGQVGAQVDVNGIKTVEGRDTGFMVSRYNGVPIIPDKMVTRGYGAGTISNDVLTPAQTQKTGSGNMYLMGSDLLTMGVLTAPTVTVSENVLINGSYTRLCDMYQQGETQVVGEKGFKSLGKVIHLA